MVENEELMLEQKFGSYRVELCQKDAAPDLMSFIREYWQEDHVLSNHRRLLDWLYFDEAKQHYNFALARSLETDEILGILGFIPTYHYDQSLEDNFSTWLSIWKVRDDVEPSGFGLQLLNFVSKYRDPISVGAVGINDEVAKIYRRLNYNVGTLNHYYMANQSKTEFALLDNFDGQHTSGQSSSDKTELAEVTESFDEIKSRTDLQTLDYTLPDLTWEYFQNRYVEHPFFDYRVFTVTRNGDISGLLPMRSVTHEGARALRWVEYCGEPDALEGIGESLQSLLQEADAEYIDIYNAGMHSEKFTNAGLCVRGEGSNTIVPNYFSPFERRNIEIQYAFNTPEGSTAMIYNGHSDMDRPNQLERTGQ